MTGLETYAIAAPAVAFVLMGAFGFLLFRRDVAYFKLSAARNAAATATTFGGQSGKEPVTSEREKNEVATVAGTIAHSEDVVGTPTLSGLAEVLLADNSGTAVSGPKSRSGIVDPSSASTKPRRSFFSSSSRKERERASAARTPESAKPDPGSAPVVPSVAAPAEPAAVTFEDAWPQSERARSDALRRTRTPSTFAEPNAGAPAPERAPPVTRSEEPPPVTVLKSGVVDGMAYSLYSDGSIEAQMPEGMMRFASIDELRSHLDQRP
jgi:hypothetical protein